MLFNSYFFICLFLPSSIAAYYLAYKKFGEKPAKWCLIGFSLAFYSWWNVALAPLLLFSILGNFVFSRLIARSANSEQNHSKKKLYLFIAITFNLLLLCYFKYANFFLALTGSFWNSQFSALDIALPLGISFFTLQQIAFQIDTYEGLSHEKKLSNYFLFVSFFPQLIAGPIVHHKQIVPQFSIFPESVFSKNFSLGLFIFALGLFKKVVLGDSLADIVDFGYSNPAELSFAGAWLTILAFTFQIYFDFSGYSDMAVGIALMFNIQLPQNFNSPYKATGMIDFWARWHLTLTSFITTYVYIPILKQFKNIDIHKAMLTTLFTFLVVGFWHGPSWLFVVFGLLHGVGIVVNHYWNRWGVKLPFFVSWFITFSYLNVLFVLFRAEDWGAARQIYLKLFNWGSVSSERGSIFSILGEMSRVFEPAFFTSLVQNLYQSGGFWVIFAAYVTFFLRNVSECSQSFKPTLISAINTALLLCMSFLFLNQPTDFIYFDF